MVLSAPRDKNNYTYAEYLTWSEDERWELLDGVAYNITAPSRRHQEVLGEFFFQIRSYLTDKPCKIYAAPFDVRFSEFGKEVGESATPNGASVQHLNYSEPGEEVGEVSNVVQPDISVVCDKSKLDDRGCLGSPDLIIEVISPTSISTDYVKKLALYEKYKVKEYWIVHPIDKTVMVFVLEKDHQYGKPGIFTEDSELKSRVLADLKINLRQVFGE